MNSKNVTKNAIPKVCLCGRPNVGKSTLFNRLLGKKRALVLDEPGVTRDVYRKEIDLDGALIELADLAGLEDWSENGRARMKPPKKNAALSAPSHLTEESKQTLKDLATHAALTYLKKADLVLFVVDSRQSLSPIDVELAKLIRTFAKEVIVVLSKVEGNVVGPEGQLEASELGWDTAIETSAEHNTGINELRETIVAKLGLMGMGQQVSVSETENQNWTDTETDSDSDSETDSDSQIIDASNPDNYQPRTTLGMLRENPVKIGVYGKPNVGKSTLVNWLLGEERMITSAIAGTTVDTVDSDFVRDGKFYRIVDTAGIRKRSKTEQGVEVLSVLRALNSIKDVDLALFLIDGYEGVSDQDEKVAGEIVKAGKPIALLVNKWDRCGVKKEEYSERLRETLGFLEFAPILFISAATGEGLDQLWDLAHEMLTQRMTIAPTGELNRFLELIEGANNPTGVRLYYASQTGKNPPHITILVSDPGKVHFAYERYIKNELRSRYGWMGSPLTLSFKARKRSEAKSAHRGMRPDKKKEYPVKLVKGDKKDSHQKNDRRH